MKHITVKILIISLSLALTVTMIPAVCFAEDGGSLSNNNVDALNFEAGSAERLMSSSSKLPEKYDLRDKGVVTPVKFQNPWGTCWSFAAIAAAETNILSDTGKTYSQTGLDLSERHLSWFSLTHITDPEDTQCGEGHWSTSQDLDKYPWDCLGDGAEGFYATTLFASGIGPVYEKDYPYTNKDGIIMWRKVNPDGTAETKNSSTCPGEGFEKYCYADKSEEYKEGTDWSINESERFKQKFELEESCMLPTPAGMTEDGSYQYNEFGTLAIKSQLLKGNAVQIGFFADTSKPNEDGEAKYLNNNTWAHYTYEQKTTNHSVCIVGYDDNYSKNNFNSGHKPPYDGAWIVKNSWGSGLNEFPNRGKGSWGVVDENGNSTGYFYLSYYDQTLKHPETLDFYTGDKSSKEDYYYVDEYDFMPVYFVGNETTDSDIRMANVFTAEADETLRAVSCQTATPGSMVTYRVYLMDKNETLKDAKKPVTTQINSYEWGGYHREDLEEPVSIKEGQSYAVEVEIVTPSGKHEMLLAKSYGKGSLDENGYNPTGDRGYVVGIINSGESILCTENTDGEKSFEDLTEVVNRLQSEDGGIYAYDNFAIKGYANPVSDTPEKIENNPVLLLKAEKSGSKAIKLSWNNVPGATKYVVYGQKCGKKYKKLKTTTGKTYTVKKIGGKKLKVHKDYKFYVVAYTPNGTVKSKTIHFITGNRSGKYANVSSIKANASTVTLSPGESKKIGATYKMYYGKKHINKSHGAALRYISDCPPVATVSPTGVVTAKAVGTATIYIQDIGGQYCKTTVTVK